MKKRFIGRISALAITAALGITMMAGCQTAAKPEDVKMSEEPSKTYEVNEEIGQLLLSVNPEITVGYDAAGNVVSLKGVNDDGKKIVETYEGFEGKSCDEVINELVLEIDDAGYFETTVDGHEKNIILKLEPGSEYPDDNFLEDIAEAVKQIISQRQMTSSAMTIDQDDYDEKYSDKGYINAATAEEILKKQLGRSDLKLVEKEYDIDDGIYEIEFTLDGKEYEYEVNASTGKVVEAEVDDNRDDADDRYDDADDRYDDADDRYDDADDRYDDADDRYDDADDRYDDADDKYDDADDRYDDADDRYDDDNDDDDDDNDDDDDDDDNDDDNDDDDDDNDDDNDDDDD